MRRTCVAVQWLLLVGVVCVLRLPAGSAGNSRSDEVHVSPDRAAEGRRDRGDRDRPPPPWPPGSGGRPFPPPSQTLTRVKRDESNPGFPPGDRSFNDGPVRPDCFGANVYKCTWLVHVITFLVGEMAYNYVDKYRSELQRLLIDDRRSCPTIKRIAFSFIGADGKSGIMPQHMTPCNVTTDNAQMNCSRSMWQWPVEVFVEPDLDRNDSEARDFVSFDTRRRQNVVSMLDDFYLNWAENKQIQLDDDQGLWILMITNVNITSNSVAKQKFKHDVQRYLSSVNRFKQVRVLKFAYNESEDLENGPLMTVSRMELVGTRDVARALLPPCEPSANRDWNGNQDWSDNDEAGPNERRDRGRDDGKPGWWLWMMLGLAVLIVSGVLITCLVLWVRKRSRKRLRKLTDFRKSHRRNKERPNMKKNDNRYSEFEPPVADVDFWEINTDRIEVSDVKLGSGAFSVVYKGVLRGVAPVVAIQKKGLQARQLTDCDCAVKMLPDYADFHAKVDFIQEINFMKDLGYYKHLVNLIACVTVDEPICLVTEYCEKGDLLHLLRAEKHNLEKDLDTGFLNRQDLLSFAWQISDGMCYLSSKGCIHRDLAARNILIDQGKTAKIGDFGLCRLLDRTLYTTRGGRLPIKWMALESLKHYEYSTKSDVLGRYRHMANLYYKYRYCIVLGVGADSVNCTEAVQSMSCLAKALYGFSWTYGVLLYEMYSIGLAPYAWLQPSDMIDHLFAGNRLQRPALAPQNIYDLMCHCWLEEPAKRPSFDAIRTFLIRVLQDGSEAYNYLHTVAQPTDSLEYVSTVSTDDQPDDDQDRL